MNRLITIRPVENGFIVSINPPSSISDSKFYPLESVYVYADESALLEDLMRILSISTCEPTLGQTVCK